jgi:type II secretory pathway pseudopilin PulG
MNRSFAPARVRGFSLIEMMVATSVGMIVVAGAVTLIVAISHANSETIQSTRINQGMRTLASVIGEEIRRARRLHDPIAYVGQGGTSNGMLDFIDTSQTNTTAGDCLIYGYQDTTLNKGLKVEEYENYYEPSISRRRLVLVGEIRATEETAADMAGVTNPKPARVHRYANSALGITP